MSATLSTTNYELPLYAGTDYANFFDMNTTNNKLDETLKSIETTAQSADTKADANADAITQTNDAIHSNMESITHIEQDLLSVQTNVNNLVTQTGNTDTKVAGIEQTVQVQGTQVTQNTQDIATLQTASTDTNNKITELEGMVVHNRSLTYINKTVTPTQIASGLFANTITIDISQEGEQGRWLSITNLSVTNAPVTSFITYQIKNTSLIVTIVSTIQMTGTATVTGFLNYYIPN